MKKIFFVFAVVFIFSFLLNPVFAINFGTYKTETDYGLIDGFKWNFFNKDGKPLVQLKSDTIEEQERLEREKNKSKEQVDEIRMYRFMLEDTVAF